MDSSTDTHQIPSVCELCSQPFSGWAVTLFGKDIRQRFCNACCNQSIANAEADELRKKDEQMTRDWNRICPDAYRTIEEGGLTDWSLLTLQHPIVESLIAWRPSSAQRGLLLHGLPREGKTRSIWRVLRGYFNRGKTVDWITPARFSRERKKAVHEFNLDGWMSDLIEVDCLLIDDLGKANWEREPDTEAQFFDLIEARTSCGMPLFVTTNENSATLKEKLGKTYGSPIVGRLFDFCDCLPKKKRTP